ncbi:MAG: hypothetical protein WCF36_00895 [Candidatus Nanopelagicales bacterium]
MTRPSGATVTGARSLELRRLARSSGLPFDSILITDALEALLARLANRPNSTYQTRLWMQSPGWWALPTL